MPAIVSLTQKKKKDGGNRPDTSPLASQPTFKGQTPTASDAGMQSMTVGGSTGGRGRELAAPMVESFEIEDADLDLEEGQSRGDVCRERIFPLDFCCCCPKGCDLIPSPFRIVQGWTHLWLLIGTIATCIMMVWNVRLIWDHLKTHAVVAVIQTDFWEEVAALLFVTPCLWYFISTIRQYDQDLRRKKQEVQQKRQELMDDFIAILSSLDDFLGETLAKTLDTAELGFECKQREFGRFLEELAKEWGETMGNADLMVQMRRFCLNWAFVFAECSIDPLGNPRLIANRHELAECKNLGQLFALIQHGSEEAQEQFIVTKRRQDAALCKENRKVFERMTETGNMLKRATSALPSCCRGFSWIRFGCCLSKREILDCLGSDGSFPKVFPFGCGAIVLLSMHHILLIVAFFGFWALLAVELSLGTMVNPTMVAVIVTVLFCLVVVLMKFEDIDLVSQLMREIALLKREKEIITKQNEQMRADWNQAQVCTDLWIYRTLPRLTLYSEIHCYFENAKWSLTEFQQRMEHTNDTLEAWEKRLPQLKEWRNDGGLDIAAKRGFRDEVTAMAGKRNLEDVLDALGKSALQWGT